MRARSEIIECFPALYKYGDLTFSYDELSTINKALTRVSIDKPITIGNTVKFDDIDNSQNFSPPKDLKSTNFSILL